MATVYSKNGGMLATSLIEGSMPTYLGNDYGYEHVFEKQLEWHARGDDLLIAISSLGRSKNIFQCRSRCALVEVCRLYVERL